MLIFAHTPALRHIVVVILAVVLTPAVLLAQDTPPQPVDQPEEFATVRAKFESLTPDEVAALGYEMEPVCVTAAMSGLPAELGGMGFHAMNRQVFDAQFNTGNLDPQNPPILLLDANKRVVGLEWEAASTTQPGQLFGQPIELLPGHPGLPEDHYMFHAYFRPNGQVLFSTWDPQLTCPAASPLPPTGTSAGYGLLGLLVSGLVVSLIGLAITRRSMRWTPR